MRKRWLSAILVASAVSAAAPPAFAQSAHGLADKGNLILTADRLVPLFSYERTSTTFQRGNNTTETDAVSRTSTMLLFSSPLDRQTVHTVPRAAADFTVIDRLTVGGFVALGFGLGGSNSQEVVTGNTRNTSEASAGGGTLVGLGPRVGYILPLSDVLAVWLRGGFSFYSLSNRNYEDDNNNRVKVSTTTTSFSIDLDPQLAIVPVEHFYFGVGPLVNIPVAGSRNITSDRGNTTTSVSNDFSQLHIGINACVGGWLSF